MKIVKTKNSSILYLFVFALLSFGLYGLSISNGYNIDDDYVCENHKYVEKGIDGIPDIFKSRYNDKNGILFGYRPITISIFAIEHSIFGESTTIGHLMNIIYCFICASLLFYVLRYITKRLYPNGYTLISAIITVLFLTHAIHSEVILSLKNREEILCLIFCLTSTITAIKYFENKKIYNLFISSIMLGIALLTKESAIVFLLIIPLTILFFKSNLKIPSINIKQKVLSISNNYDKHFFLITCATLSFLCSLIVLIWKLGSNACIPKIYDKIPDIAFYVFFLMFTFQAIRNHKVLLNKKNVAIYIISVAIFAALRTELAFIVSTLLLMSTMYLKQGQADDKINGNSVDRKDIISIFIFVLVAGIVIILAYYIPQKMLPESNSPVFKWQNPGFEKNEPFDKAAIALYSLIYYLKLLIIPYPLRFYYGYKMIPEVGMLNPIVLISLIVHIFLLVIAIRGFNKRSLLSYGILFYLIAIFPFANTFFPFTGIIAERMLFTPSIGFAIVIGYFICKIFKIDSGKQFDKNLKYKVWLTALIIVVPNSLITISRNDDWKNRKKLYSHDIQYLENSAKANVLYANLLKNEVFNKIQKMKQGDTPTHLKFQKEIDASIKHFKRAIEIDSTYANPWFNLGYMNQIIFKDYKKSEEQLRNAIKYDSNIFNAYLYLGISEVMQGKYNPAIENLKKYESSNSYEESKDYGTAYFFIGKSYSEISKYSEASTYYELCIDSLKIDGFKSVLINEIKSFVDKSKNYDLAKKLADKEILLFPDKDLPYVDKGNYCILSGDTTCAIYNWEIAFEKYEGNLNIAQTLYNYYLSIGNLDKANYYKQAILKGGKGVQ